MDFLEPTLILKSHRAKRLTGKKNRQVEQAIRQRGLEGLTPVELEAQLHWQPNTAGGRLSEVRDLGYIRKTGATRNGHHVWIHTGKVLEDENRVIPLSRTQVHR